MIARGDAVESAPWDFFAPHAAEPLPFFIDRGPSPGGASRPSFAGSRPSALLVVDTDGVAREWSGDRWQPRDGDPVQRIAEFVEAGRLAHRDAPRFLDGEPLPRTVGFLAYELGPWADGPPRGARRRRSASGGEHEHGQQHPHEHQGDDDAPMRAGTPLAVLARYDAFDAWDGARRRRVRVQLAAPGPAAGAPPSLQLAGATWRPTSRRHWQLGFERVQEAIAAGDIYQANLSRRAVFDFDGDAAAAYARLRDVQPVPFGAFLDYGGFALLSNSPELFLARHGDRLVTSPIKGTRARRDDARGDAEAADDLRRDPKERAEHLMIVDLERNDLGRVARTGSVHVPRFAEVESFATVHHLVSDVRATLRDGTPLADLLRATFPGGSITGAPKRRAMEILDDVERDERGPYTGAIGIFDGGGDLELSIAIRTAVASGTKVLYSTGGGIVADSDAGREWDETEWKVAALREALARREADLTAAAGAQRRRRAGSGTT